MFKFNVNGKEVVAEKVMKLLPFLRDNLGITSVKNGCAEGACGTCMVLVDGKATKACILSTDKLEGKNILTVDGIAEKEMKIYEWAFAEAGAVQCGFCIPGMVISAKGLLDVNNNPTEADIQKALRGNICRCTGYVKIIEAVMKVAKALRENYVPPVVEYTGKVGERFPRVDAIAKTNGTAIYAEDVTSQYIGTTEEINFGGALRTKYPRALVKKIDISKAKEVPGVIGVFTAKDVTGKRNIGHLEFISDWDALIAEGEITRYIGDAVALVAATSKEALKAGLAAIEVDYEELEVLDTPRKALAEGAPLIHKKEKNILFQQKLSRGNVDAAINKSTYVVTHTYQVPFTEHAPMEIESCTALPMGDGVHLFVSDQSVFDVQHEVSRLLGLPHEKVRVTSTYVGGGFGGKEDMSVQHHAGMLAYLTKKPIQVTLTRQESLNVSVKRHAMEIEMTHACDDKGILTAMKCNIISDTGAYASLGGPVLQRACTHASGPYNYHNIEVLGTAVYTNNVPAGAFRGFGVTQSAFATEANLNELAKLVGISEWEIRMRNAIEPGLVLPNGQIADKGTALKETLLAVKDVFESNKNAGIACAFKNAGIGVGLPDIGKAIVSVEKGKVHIRNSAACIGQGFATVATQMVCEATGLTPKDMLAEHPDTHRMPDSGTTTASRQTVFSGEAVKAAAKKLAEALKTKKLSDLEGQEFYGEYSCVTDPIGSDKPNPKSHVGYGYATQVVILNDEGKIVKVVAAHDVGRAINPINVEGQIEGGVIMGLGYAVTEDFTLTKGIPNQKYGTLGLFRADMIPEIESIIIEKNTEDLAYGAKGVGEITTIPTAPAVQGAYYRLDGKFRTKLPLEETFYRKKKI